jgi:hypothetical protein
MHAKALAVDGEPRAVPFPHPMITEILYAVPTGVRGDANADGERQTSGDEFIEIINPHDKPINLKGYRLRDGAAIAGKKPPKDAKKPAPQPGRSPANVRQRDRDQPANNKPADGGVVGKASASAIDFEFPSCELGPGEIAVIFNGLECEWGHLKGRLGTSTSSGRPVDEGSPLAGARVFTMNVQTSRVGLANKGDLVVLVAPDGDPIHAVHWGEASAKPPEKTLLIEVAPALSGKSVERTGLGEEAEWKAHEGDVFGPGRFSSQGASVSPGPAGKMPKATPRDDGDAEATPKAAPMLHPLISEVLVTVPPKADPDRDGVFDAAGDQFIELVNPHAEAIDLSGYVLTLGAGSEPGTTGIAAGQTLAVWTGPSTPTTALAPGEVIVIFNASARANRPEPAEKDRGKFGGALIGLALPGDQPRAMDPRGGWVTLTSPSGLVIETVWWGTPLAIDHQALTADVTEQAILTPESPTSVRRSPGSPAFTAHPLVGGVAFSPGKSEFKPKAKPAKRPPK